MEFSELIQYLDTLGITVLLAFIWWRSEDRVKQKEEEIQKLNEYIRLSDKENIKTLSEFGKFLESLIANVDTIKGELAKEISHSAEMVKNRIDNLKVIIESKNEPR